MNKICYYSNIAERVGLVDFLLVLIAILSLGVKAEALQAKIDTVEIRRFHSNAVSLTQNFRSTGTFPTNHFRMDS